MREISGGAHQEPLGREAPSLVADEPYIQNRS